jgi:hypothetical protein
MPRTTFDGIIITLHSIIGIWEGKNQGGDRKKFARLFHIVPDLLKKNCLCKLSKIVVDKGGGQVHENAFAICGNTTLLLDICLLFCKLRL